LPAEPARPEPTHPCRRRSRAYVNPRSLLRVPEPKRAYGEPAVPDPQSSPCHTATRHRILSWPSLHTQRMSCHCNALVPASIHALCMLCCPFFRHPRMHHHTDKCPHRPLVRREGSANATSASLAPCLLIALATWLIDAVSGELYLFPGMARIKVKRFLPRLESAAKTSVSSNKPYSKNKYSALSLHM
jgi:hypothetical protein